ncbi:D-glycero-beta-D-manno-heptose 1,7-bisphosphate 7-phosphatase [Aestuariicella hydrocarbonica]|uniref:D,D-heptose 1,7-bisphosphate phosphatase n=1 Tax=Pseudomaricurvus hydrocarbonicus TaxID=1470433 RepID=A0A9E5MP94_9GAMM|nr:D-glycero-beta-D-manno-heptose 1,7-bisphosphate 7-phosphatase [Aestuariicella hydrocarbonica]NHO67931.1 D-glycero-beta-D-manno-heptose 1,7-bisphosphate 7-phosphatase [Aestuariicella hydrocarbonica]
MPKTKLVILDRDGVINRDSDAFVKSVDEFILIDGSAEAIAHLHHHGFTVVIATNQSGIARGYFSTDDLEAMHNKLRAAVASAGGEISAVFYCPHGPDDGCTCRKPLPGLIEQIEKEFETSAAGVPVVGDSLRDLQAGTAKGCDPILVKTGKGEKTLRQLAEASSPNTQPADEKLALDNLPVFDNLQQAAFYITEHYG